MGIGEDYFPPQKRIHKDIGRNTFDLYHLHIITLQRAHHTASKPLPIVWTEEQVSQ